jgi:hypothetical protein
MVTKLLFVGSMRDFVLFHLSGTLTGPVGDETDIARDFWGAFRDERKIFLSRDMIIEDISVRFAVIWLVFTKRAAFGNTESMHKRFRGYTAPDIRGASLTVFLTTDNLMTTPIWYLHSARGL